MKEYVWEVGQILWSGLTKEVRGTVPGEWGKLHVFRGSYLAHLNV